MGGRPEGDRLSTLLCLGFGYSATHYVARHGPRFDRIIGTTRMAANATELGACRFGGRTVEMIVFDGEVATPALIDAVRAASVLLVSISPAAGIDPTLARLNNTLAAAPQLASIVYLSTIAVYGNHDGAWIDEDTPLTPALTRAEDRIEAERAWQALGAARGVPVSIIRIAGIYGPGQNALVNVRLGRARNVAKPGQVFNRIHVADIAQAIDATFAHGADGVFNVTDDAPTPPGDPIVFAAGLLGMASPPEIPFAEAAATMTPIAASFYAENRRVRNERLKTTLGVTLRYPTYREGLAALHKAGD
jgi:nucleoside-diphosphate-sugar epimerase